MQVYKLIPTYISPLSRQKIYLIMVFISLILLFYSAHQIAYVVVESKDIFGLIDYLTPCYWTGLILLVIISIFVFLDSALNNDLIYLFILFVLGLFLIVYTAFIYENPTESANFYPFSEINNWLPSHSLGIANQPNVASYYSWPAFQFISAFIVLIWGISFDFFLFAKYVPLLFLILFILICYSIGKRLNLEPKGCFLLSFLSLASWLSITADYSARTIGLMLLLLLFMLLLTQRQTISEIILTILIYSAIIITHSLTIIAIIPAFILFSFYKRSYRFLILFLVIFGGWYLFQAYLALSLGIQQALAYPFRQLLIFSRMEYGEDVTSSARIMSHYAWLTYMILYCILMLGSILMLLFRKIPAQRKNIVISAFAWAIGIGIVMLLLGFNDASLRIYSYCLVPAVCIFVLSFDYKRKIFAIIGIVLMCILVVPHMPAEYSDEMSWGQILTSDAKGADFFAVKVKPTDIYYNAGHIPLVYYYNPSLSSIPVHQGAVYEPWRYQVDISTLDRVSHVILSNKGSGRAFFIWGKDPYALWSQTAAGQTADLIYNNNGFQVYANRHIK